MNPRDRMIALMEGRQVPQTMTPQQDRLDFSPLQTDSPQALLGNPRTSAPGVINGAFHQQQYMTIQVPLEVGMVWQGLLKAHDLDHDVEVVEALKNHLTSLESNFWQPSDS